MSDAGLEAVPMAGHSQENRNACVKVVLKGLDDLNAQVFFEKPLTSSDASGSGRVVIPKVRRTTIFCINLKAFGCTSSGPALR
jgi:hypothetical protein